MKLLRSGVTLAIAFVTTSAFSVTFQVLQSSCDVLGSSPADIVQYQGTQVSNVIAQGWFFMKSNNFGNGYVTHSGTFSFHYKWKVRWVPSYPGDDPAIGVSYTCVLEERHATGVSTKSSIGGSSEATVGTGPGASPLTRYSSAPRTVYDQWGNPTILKSHVNSIINTYWNYNPYAVYAGVVFSYDALTGYWIGEPEYLDLTPWATLTMDHDSPLSGSAAAERYSQVHLLSVAGHSVSTAWSRLDEEP